MAKRKREDDDDDSDDERPTGQAQILPVAKKLPANGEITDGLEYLFTVRRDALRLPHIASVPNPYAQPDRLFPPPPRTDVRSLMPSEEWRKMHVERPVPIQNVLQPAQAKNIGPRAEPPAATPGFRERVLWWKFLAGEPESVWNAPVSRAAKRKRFFRGEEYDEPEEETAEMVFNEDGELLPAAPKNAGVHAQGPVAPREPTPHLLKAFDEDMSVYLLRHFAFWIRGHVKEAAMYDMTELHARWMFALLARLGQHMSADHMNSLRQVARACIELLQRRMQTRISSSAESNDARDDDIASSAASSPRATPEPGSRAEGHPIASGSGSRVDKAVIVDSVQLDKTMPTIDGNAFSERSCWVLLGTIIGVWGQTDLWEDVENMLRGLPTVA